MTIREKLLEAYPDQEFLFADGFDEAIIGVDEDPFGQHGGVRLIYSVRKALDLVEAQMGPVLPETDDEDPEDPRAVAREFFDYNVAGAYVGKQTPIWCEDAFSELG